MKTWNKWIVKKEGVNPTDFESAGKDQDLDNAGIPFDGPSINKVAAVEKERDEIEREYQLKLFKMIDKKPKETDPTKLDPTKGPHGQTTGGMIDEKIKQYLKDRFEEMEKWKKKNNEVRSKVPVKTTSTAFIKDRKNLFSPRDDENPPKVDRHGAAADNKK